MKIEINPFETVTKQPRYCSECDDYVMDVWDETNKRHCPVCGGEPTLEELGT